MTHELKSQIGSTAFAFRGYNITNVGKTPELLAHRVYGPTIEEYLRKASEICSDATKHKVDLVQRVQHRSKSTAKTYPQDLSQIVAVELAQIKLLVDHFGLNFGDAQLVFGYSLGEVSALIACGVFEMEAALHPLLVLAKDAVKLAENVTMGIVFSRGPALDLEMVARLCTRISSRGQGVISISTYLSPNTVLLLGQGETIDLFKSEMDSVFPTAVNLRKNPHHWPPIHTPITRQCNISDRAGVLLDTVPGGFTEPDPPILSCITGEVSYNDYNSRELLTRWIDSPQHVWGVVEKTLAAGVTKIIHVGPEPNIFPSTFSRLSANVSQQLASGTFNSIRLRAISRFARRRWLTNILSRDANLLLAPFVRQIMLEDWLLENDPSAQPKQEPEPA